MIVSHYMSKDLVSIKKEASIQEALALMKQHSIRHLPVVDAERTLLGWVTDADLRGVLIASMLEELTLEDVMVRKPYAVHPDMPLDEAAHLILEKRIGGLPVVEQGKLVGIITVVDILSAFISMMGLFTQSSRLDVKTSAPLVSLQELSRLLQDHGAKIISICHSSALEGTEDTYAIRLQKIDLKPILAELKAKGIQVVSSIP
jgi:acetoin utilization protein AcuB